MKHFLKIQRGVIALLIVGTILLLSDLSNRKQKDSGKKDVFVIATVNWIDSPIIDKIEKGIREGLNDRGLVEGRNFKMNTYKAFGDVSLLNSIFNQVRTLHPDLIFTSCTPALQAAIKNISKIPVVFTAVADPVLAGAGTDAENHLANITGCTVECDFTSMCALINEVAPNIITLGSVYCPGEIISVKLKNEFTRMAAEYNLEVKFFPANNSTELPDAVLSLCNAQIDAVCQMGDNLMASGISTLIKGIIKADIPYFAFNRRPEGTKMESLIQIDPDYFQNGYDAAVYAAEILLENESPADLPFKSPTNTILEINPAKAKKYGITFIENLKKKADIIYADDEQI